MALSAASSPEDDDDDEAASRSLPPNTFLVTLHPRTRRNRVKDQILN